MKVKGKVTPLRDRVFVSDMEFGGQQSAGGIFIPSANGKAEGITPRWGRVWAIGPDQKEIKVGEWICVEHGRWTRTIEIEQEDGSILEVRMVDTKDVMMTADEKPQDQVYRRLD
jgi:co-chaperonin GroES (HSP10)